MYISIIHNIIDIFTIVPTTRYVWINQTATFTCATNVTGLKLGFSIPAGVAHVTTPTDLPGGGQLATCSFTVTSDNNGTSTRCLATENGGLPVDVSCPVNAYGQGMEYILCTCIKLYILSSLHDTVGPPSSVVDLTAVQQECDIFISWQPLYLLPGLSVSYKVYINGEMIQDDISTTNHTYYPTVTSSTVYSISVVAYNESVDDGPPADTMAYFNICKLLYICIIMLLSLPVATDVLDVVVHKLSPGHWMFQFTILVSI